MSAVVVQGRSNASLGNPGVRQLSSALGPHYVPSKATYCRQCAACKKQSSTGWGGTMSPECNRTCKKCPNAVALGAEASLTLELDGIVATEYTRQLPVVLQGRALQGSSGNASRLDFTEIHYGTTVFEGQCESVARG